MSNAVINLPLGEWQEAQNKLQKAEQDAEELRRNIRTLEREDPSGRVTRLFQTLDDALTVARYAVGNLDPSTVRGWPFEALRALGERLQSLPGATAEHTHLGLEFVNFAREAEAVEKGRVMRDAREQVKAELRAEAEAVAGD